MNMELIILAEIGIASTLALGAMILDSLTTSKVIRCSQERMLSYYKSPEQFKHYLRYLEAQRNK